MSISVRGLLHLSAALSLVFALACAQAATLSFEPVQIAGVEMKLPKGWQQHRDDYSLILTEQPNDPASAVLALFALSAGPGAALTAEQLACCGSTACTRKPPGQRSASRACAAPVPPPLRN
jgi:hypothetical protein